MKRTIWPMPLDWVDALRGIAGFPPSPADDGEWTHGEGGHAPLGTRCYRLFIPREAAGVTALPLIVLLHGCQQDSAAIICCARAVEHARARRFALLVPEQSIEANPQRCWNWLGPEAVLRLELEALALGIADVIEHHPVRGDRVFLLGLSAGGSMAMQFALHHPARCAAVASHSGACPVSGPPVRSGGPTPPPLLLVHGDADPVVPGFHADAASALWRGLSADGRCWAESVRRLHQPGRRVCTSADWRADARLRVRSVRIHGLAHAWCGGREGVPFADPAGPDALELACAFFDEAVPASGLSPRAAAAGRG